MRQAKTERSINVPSFFFLGTLILSIAGCGGGGSSGSGVDAPNTTKNSSPFDGPTLERKYFSINEGSRTLLAGNLKEATLDSYSTEPEINIDLFVASDGNGIYINTPYVDSPKVVKLSLTFAAGGFTSKEEVSVHIRNTSAQKLEDRTQQIIADSTALLNLEQDFALYHFSVDVAYLNGLIPNLEKQELLEAFAPENSVAHALLESKLSEIESNYVKYAQGLLSDSALERSLSSIDELAREHGGYGTAMLMTVSHFSEIIVPTLTSGSISFAESAGFFSRFVGNPEYGTWQGETYELKPPYDTISSLIRTNLSQEIRCDAI